MILCIASVLLIPSQTPGMAIVRRLVLTPKPDVGKIDVRKFGTSYKAGDGRVFVLLNENAEWKAAAQSLLPYCTTLKAIPPRMSGVASTQAQLDRFVAKLRAARKEYTGLPTFQGRLTKLEMRNPRGIKGQTARLDWSESRKPSLPIRTVLPPAEPAAEVWVNDGPYNLQSPSQEGGGALSPINGRIGDAAYDFSNPSRIFAAAGRGGVWRSENNGIDWTPLSDNWLSMATNVVKTNPNLPGRVYVGTGDFPTNFGTPMGIMFSDDNGDTWEQRGADEFSDTLITDIAVSPTTPTKLFVASGGSTGGKNLLWVTPDEGVTWSKAIDVQARWTDLDISDLTGGKRYIYAAGTTGDANVILYRSEDDGATFTSLSIPTAVDGDRPYISCSKVKPSVVYLHYHLSQRVWKNTGRGGTWVEITGDLIDTAGSDWAQEDFNYGIQCVRRNTQLASIDALFVQNTDTYVTKIGSATDGTAGDQWKSFTLNYTGSDLIHVDHHGIIPHPTDPLKMLFCNDGGIYSCFYEMNPNNGVFTTLNKNLVTALVSRISIPFVPANGVLAGMQDNGMGYVGGDFTNWGNVYNGDLGHSAINPQFPANMVLMPANFAQGNDEEDPPGFIIETTDDWLTKEKRAVDTKGDKRRSSCPIAYDPTLPRFIYAATNYLYRYDRLNQTWESKLGNQKLDSQEHVRHLAVAPTNPNRIYTVGKTGDVYRSDDAGANWKIISEGVSGLPNVTLSHVSVDPNNDKRVLVAIEETGLATKLYECLDTTADPAVWIDRHGALGNPQLPKVPIIAIARHPNQPSSFWFVASDAGVFMTKDSGASWSDLTPDGTFPNVPVTDIKIQASTARIFVSTYGRGVWHRSLPRALQTKNPRGGG